MWTPSDLERRRTGKKKRLYTPRERQERKQSSFGPLSPLDIVAEGPRFVTDSWPHERLQRNAKTDQQPRDWKERKGLICTRTFFKNPIIWRGRSTGNMRNLLLNQDVYDNLQLVNNRSKYSSSNFSFAETVTHTSSTHSCTIWVIYSILLCPLSFGRNLKFIIRHMLSDIQCWSSSHDYSDSRLHSPHKPASFHHRNHFNNLPKPSLCWQTKLKHATYARVCAFSSFPPPTGFPPITDCKDITDLEMLRSAPPSESCLISHEVTCCCKETILTTTVIKNIYIYIVCPQQMVLCPLSPFHFAFNHHFHFTAFHSAWLTGQSIKQIRLIVPLPAITFFSSSELNSLITFLIQLLILGRSLLLGLCL